MIKENVADAGVDVNSDINNKIKILKNKISDINKDIDLSDNPYELVLLDQRLSFLENELVASEEYLRINSI